MKYFLILLLVVSFSSFSIGTSTLKIIDNQYPVIVRVYFNNQHQVQKLSEITPLWEVNSNQGFALLMINGVDEYKKIKSLELPIHIDRKRQIKYFTDQKLSSKTIQGSQTIPGFSCYSTVEGTFARMNDMVSNYPNLAEIVDIGDSWEKSVDINNGYDLKVLKITNQNGITDKPIVFITSAIHAREYTTAELTTRFAEMLTSQYESNADIRWMLDHQEIQLLIHTNPDGRKKAETGLLWRKNTNTAYCSPMSDDRGADLNRNYTYFWEANGNQCGQVFPGSSALSEPEIDSVMSHLNAIYDDNRGAGVNDSAPDDTAGVFLDIHSFSQLILWPWGFTSNQAPNADQFKAFGKRVAFFNQYKPEPVSDLTIAKGGSIDSSYGELGVASLAFELGTDFFQNCDEFENNILQDNLNALIYISRVARTPYITPFGPDIEDLTLIPNFVNQGQVASISGLANDDRYNQSNGLQAIEQVNAIEMYINDLPWLNLNAENINAEDGALDSSLEHFSHAIDTSSLSIGKNQVYIVATDSNNKVGGVFAKFLTVVDLMAIGTLAGNVTDAISGSAINASQLKINESVAISGNLGEYSMFVPPSTSNLLVSANGYLSKTVENIAIVQQQTTSLDIQLQPFCSIFLDDIESGIQQWNAQSPWTIVDTNSVSPSHSWTDSPNSNYSDNTDVRLTSQDIAIAGADNLEISYDEFCDTEAGFDFGRVEVNFDNSTWNEVHRCDGGSAWESVSQQVDIPTNSQSLKIRFRLTSDGFVTRPGWNIDNVELKVTGQPCLLMSPDIVFINGFE